MRENEKAYFVTLTVGDWLDVFARKNHKLKLVESLIYCQKHKGLEIYGWCLMSSHLHMIARAIGRQILPEILRDLKKYTAKAIIQQIEDEPESRKEWFLARFNIVSSPQASSDFSRVTDLSAFGGRAPTGVSKINNFLSFERKFPLT
jgi:REP element-mobilizing transposase RayT